jgi:basic amino acid/polyamine antiporter, APA family
VVVGSVIGSSIFRLPGGVVREVGSAGAVFLVWALGGIIALCGALSLAELATLYPRTGGMYVFLRETYGRWAAFLFGWAMLVINPAAYAFVAMVFAESLTTLAPTLAGWERFIAALSLVVLVVINVRPVRVGAAFLNTTTWLKVAVLVMLSAAALLVATSASSAAATSGGFAPKSWSGFGLGLILVMGAYDGWQWVPQIAGEMRDPSRSLPRALGLGVLIVVGVYLIANAAYLMVLSPEELTASTLVTADVAQRVLGAVGAGLVALLIMVSSFGSNHSGMMTDPRVFLAMAEDGLFFRVVGAIHPKHRTPHIAVILLGAASIAYLFIRGVEELIATLILGMWPFLAMSVMAVIIQRRRNPNGERSFRVPLYPLVPGFFLLACAGIFANSFRERPRFTVINFLVLVAGLPVYWLWRRRT